jgi:hypothetical protein
MVAIYGDLTKDQRRASGRTKSKRSSSLMP